jgi:hypothetical protein
MTMDSVVDEENYSDADVIVLNIETFVVLFLMRFSLIVQIHLKLKI